MYVSIQNSYAHAIYTPVVTYLFSIQKEVIFA